LPLSPIFYQWIVLKTFYPGEAVIVAIPPSAAVRRDRSYCALGLDATFAEGRR